MQVGHLPERDRALTRSLALAYRRIWRASDHSPRNVGAVELQATAAAMAEYRRLVATAPANDLECSKLVILIIAAAINANTKWFWEDPDA
jgi:hypothetical protein